MLENGIESNLENVKSIIILPSTKEIKPLETFINKEKYMARFIPLSPYLLYPLQQVVNNDPFQWHEECEILFQNFKEVLGTMPTMQAPNWESM